VSVTRATTTARRQRESLRRAGDASGPDPHEPCRGSKSTVTLALGHQGFLWTAALDLELSYGALDRLESLG